jgi:hypothetical protein
VSLCVSERVSVAIFYNKAHRAAEIVLENKYVRNFIQGRPTVQIVKVQYEIWLLGVHRMPERAGHDGSAAGRQAVQA